ncbi:hypothetical protein ANANG_G00028230 [Anguilla anguilla]|uniref:Uncharacterized protein n=1 Tax=Anguilla anguilla TaxID=7936 RepID=A0A9D3S341_ANGAN|nr:hypothetical protein ANANG_G00028230 [Anguilla anguilla]
MVIGSLREREEGERENEGREGERKNEEREERRLSQSTSRIKTAHFIMNNADLSLYTPTSSAKLAENLRGSSATNKYGCPRRESEGVVCHKPIWLPKKRAP